MCVILVAQAVRPRENMVRACWMANDDGGGVAFRGAQDGLVHWKKGLDLDEMIELAQTLPLPYVMHFRITSSGPSIDALTHPFPIDENAPTSLQGKTKGSVLFHNGHWARWRDLCLDAMFKGGRKMPGGSWSDTRAMAWLAGCFGIGFLEWVDEANRLVVFGPKGTLDFQGRGWTQVEGIMCSNDGFKHRMHNLDDIDKRKNGETVQSAEDRRRLPALYQRPQGGTQTGVPPEVGTVAAGSTPGNQSQTGIQLPPQGGGPAEPRPFQYLTKAARKRALKRARKEAKRQEKERLKIAQKWNAEREGQTLH